MYSDSITDHIANAQNDAWWEGQGHRFRPFPSHNASNVALAIPTMHHSGHWQYGILTVANDVLGYEDR